MHELGLVYQVVKTVDGVVKGNNLVEVDKIILQVGEMSDVVPKFLEEAWQAAAPTTDYPSAKMIVEVMPATAKCRDCGYEGHVKTFAPDCPHCSSSNLKITSGRQFDIKEIVAK